MLENIQKQHLKLKKEENKFVFYNILIRDGKYDKKHI